MKKAQKKTMTTNNETTNHVTTPTTTSPSTPPATFDPAVLPMITPNAAGIDVASEEMWVCVPADRAAEPVRKFGACTADLYAIADWLTACRITRVAMESTGVYWIPLYQVLEERGFGGCLVNARHLKNVSGRPKTDRLDCQWIQRLHAYGFLMASFRPNDAVCRIRAIQRHRDALIQRAARHIQHMQKALHQMNVLLDKVVSDITGTTGMAIIQKILDGERKPQKLAKLRNWHCQASEEEIARALEGDYRAEHVFVLRQAVTAYQFTQRQMHECDREIEKLLQQIEKQVDAHQTPPPVRSKGATTVPRNAYQFDARTLLYERVGVDVTQMPGVDAGTGVALFAELGADLTAWPTAKQFISWLGFAPNKKVSGGKVLDSGTRKVQSRAARAFRRAARAVGRSKSYLGAFYQRMKARLGAPKAITATARKMATIFYHMVKERKGYQELGQDYYLKQHRQRQVKRLQKQAQLLGYDLVAH